MYDSSMINKKNKTGNVSDSSEAWLIFRSFPVCRFDISSKVDTASCTSRAAHALTSVQWKELKRIEKNWKELKRIS